MLDLLLNNKWKMVALAVGVGLGLILYLGWKEYTIESKVCLEQGGELIWDEKGSRLYCQLPESKRYKWWWE
jgi:hypothetical protein